MNFLETISEDMPQSYFMDESDAGEDFLSEEESDSDDGETAESLGFAAAKKLMGRRRRRAPLPSPAGKGYVRPVVQPRAPATQSQLAGGLSRVGEDFKRVNAAIKTLEARLDSYSGQLASLQEKKTGEQAANLFRYALTNYLSGATTGVMGREWGQLVIRALPLVQAMLTGKGGISSSFSAMPWSTALFPVGSILAVWLLRKPKPPVITYSDGQVHIAADLIPFATTRYTINGEDPLSSGDEYKSPFRIEAIKRILFFFRRKTRRKIKAKTFNLLGMESDTTSYDI